MNSRPKLTLTALLIAFGGFGCGSGQPDVNPRMGVVAAGVRWVGRVDATTPTAPRFGWSGTGFVAQFSGTGLTAALSLTA